MENTGESVISLGSGEGECAEVKKPKMRWERKRIREEELKMLSDLSALQNLAAMLEAEKIWKRKKGKRKKKKANIYAGAQEIAAVDAADEDKANSVTAVEPTESFETKPVDMSDKYVLKKVDAAYENNVNAVIGVETAGSFKTCLVKKSDESLLEKVDATYENMAKTVIDVEIAALFGTRPEAKSVLSKVDAVYENKAQIVIDVETTDSFRTGPVAKSVLEKVDAGCENKEKIIISVEIADLIETKPAEKSVLEKVDAGYENKANTVKYADPTGPFKTRMAEKSEESVLEKVHAADEEDNSNSVLAVETADSFETKPVEISEKYVLEKSNVIGQNIQTIASFLVDAAYENKANTITILETAKSFKVDAAYENKANTITVLETAKSLEARPIVKSEESVLEKVDSAYESKAITVINVEPAELLQTSPVEKLEGLSFTIDEERGLQKAKKPCPENEELMCSLDDFKILSDLSNFKNLAAMMKAEAILRQKKIERKKNKRKIEFEAQDDLSVQEVKAGAQVDKIQVVEMRKTSETESVSATKIIPKEELLVSNFQINGETILEEAKNCKKNEEVMSYLDELNMISDLSNFKNLAAMMEAEGLMRCKKRKKRRKENRDIEIEVPLQINVNSMQEQKLVDTCKSVDTVKLFAVKDNIVQQRLRRAPRYFETSESSWRICDNCGKGGHTAVHCSNETQKPCCLCGSFKPSGDHCNQVPKCFVYERSKHTKISPEENQGNCSSSMICLRCGDSGHDMFSCRNEYSSDDLKEIQCYVCKRFGHLCCVDLPDIRQAQQAWLKAYLGSDCTKWQGDWPNPI